MSPHEHLDVAQLADVHAVARKLVWSLRNGEGGDRLVDVGKHMPTKPPIAGVYALLVLPTRYQSVFKDVRNWLEVPGRPPRRPSRERGRRVLSHVHASRGPVRL